MIKDELNDPHRQVHGLPLSPTYSTAPTFQQMSSAMVSVFVLASNQQPFPHVVTAAATISQLNMQCPVVKVA
jgi:hypothetical protein